jgi:hypothetical protein
MKLFYFLVAFAATAISTVTAATFRNPIKDRNEPDPFMVMFQTIHRPITETYHQGVRPRILLCVPRWIVSRPFGMTQNYRDLTTTTGNNIQITRGTVRSATLLGLY